MPVEVRHSPPPLHEPTHNNSRPRGILKNPSFSAQGGRAGSPVKEELPPSTPLDPVEAKELTLQNTLQNAGPRRSSSAARRASNSRRHSSAAGIDPDDSDKMRLKWDEANLFLAEQQSGGRMKITEPKTPYQHGDGGAMDEDEEEDVAIDPRYVNVDEVDMAKRKAPKARESEIPGLELGDPEEEIATAGVPEEDERIIRGGNLSRESSKEKHVSVSEGTDDLQEHGMETEEKHREFEEKRKRHYEMRNMKGLLGHPDDMENDEEDDPRNPVPAALPSRGINGTR